MKTYDPPITMLCTIKYKNVVATYKKRSGVVMVIPMCNMTFIHIQADDLKIIGYTKKLRRL